MPRNEPNWSAPVLEEACSGPCKAVRVLVAAVLTAGVLTLAIAVWGVAP